MATFAATASASFNAFALAIFDVNTALNAAGDALTKPVGQSSARWRVLGRVSQGPQTVSQIAGRIGHARQSVQRISDDLVEAGLARYLAAPSDRRTQLLELTDEGHTVLTGIESQQSLWTERLGARLDAGVLDQLTHQLGAIQAEIVADHKRAFGDDN